MDQPARQPGFRILAQRLAYQGFTRLELFDVAQTGLSGETVQFRREIETHGNGAAVLAFDPQRRIAVLVRQLRLAVGLSLPDAAYLLEVIAGLSDHPGDDAAATARREALEEAGLQLGTVVAVGDFYSTPGLSTERIALFLAEIDLVRDRIEAGGGLRAEHEDIEVVEVKLDELARLADAHELLDLKTFSLVQTLRLRRPDLFT